MFAELLVSRLAGICELSPQQIERLRQHYELLIRWNKILNLTSLHKLEDIVERHYCESIFASVHLPEAVSIADIGSGAGFPGLPVAVVRPKCSVTLIESHHRKAAFLKEATRDLANVRVVAKRAQDVAERFDWAVSRAVRYSDLAAALQRLAPNVGLLTGEVSASELAGFAWDPPRQLPWGDRRYLWIGHVPRGTSFT